MIILMCVRIFCADVIFCHQQPGSNDALSCNDDAALTERDAIRSFHFVV